MSPPSAASRSPSRSTGETGDPEAAKAALEESGLTLPVAINVAYRKNDTMDKVFAGLKTGWDAAGFETNLIGIPAEQYYGTLQSPDSATQDYGYFDNDEFNAGIDAAYQIADQAEREAAWGQLDADAVTEHFAVIPLIVDQFVFVRGSNVQGAYVNGTFTGYYDIATVSLKG